MAVMIGLGVAGLVVGVAGAMSAKRDARSQAEAQYKMSVYQQRRQTDAANLKRAYNLRTQLEQRQNLFNAGFREYHYNSGQAKDVYAQQTSQASQVYSAGRGALLSQMEGNGMSSSSGSAKALAFSALRQASNQMLGYKDNLADTQTQLKDRLDTTLSQKVNADSPSLFIQGTGPTNASGMSNLLGAASAGLGGMQAGMNLAGSIQNYNPSTAPATTSPTPGQYTVLAPQPGANTVLSQ